MSKSAFNTVTGESHADTLAAEFCIVYTSTANLVHTSDCANRRVKFEPASHCGSPGRASPSLQDRPVLQGLRGPTDPPRRAGRCLVTNLDTLTTPPTTGENDMSTTTASYIEEILEYSDYSEVAYRRIGFGLETWDITGPDEDATIRIADDDGLIIVTLLTGGRAMLEAGRMTFSHNLAAPAFVASAIDQIAADYL